jgi:hypothetical protein
VTPYRLRILVLGLIAIGLIIVGLFGLRTLHAFREIRGSRPAPDIFMESVPEETKVELIRDWMTIPFIARMHGIQPSVLYKALDISPRGNEGKSLTQLNSEYYPEAPGLVVTRIKAVVLENLSSENPPPTKPAP